MLSLFMFKPEVSLRGRARVRVLPLFINVTVESHVVPFDFLYMVASQIFYFQYT